MLQKGKHIKIVDDHVNNLTYIDYMKMQIYNITKSMVKRSINYLKHGNFCR